MNITAKIKDIDQKEVWSQSSIGCAGIVTNGICKIDGIDFIKKIVWYDSFVMMFFSDGSDPVTSPKGRCIYAFQQVEWVNINGIEIKLIELNH